MIEKEIALQFFLIHLQPMIKWAFLRHKQTFNKRSLKTLAWYVAASRFCARLAELFLFLLL